MASLLNRMKQIFWYAGCKDEDEFQSVRENIYRNNMKILRLLSTLTFVVMLILYLIAETGVLTSEYDSIYKTFAMLAGICTFLIWNEGKEYSSKTFIFLYAFLIISLSFGIVSGIYFGSESKAVSFMVILMGVPALFVDRPIRMYLVNAIAIFAFVQMDRGVKSQLLFEADAINAITYSIFGMVLNFYTVKLHMESFLNENRMKILSEVDLLTGLKNRNAFENNLQIYSMIAENNLTCIYIDVNGLHELNNSKGHAAGDKMLKYIARKVVDIFGREDGYRIGGDEYVIFVIDGDKQEISLKINKLNEYVKEQNYSISIGQEMENIRDIDISELIDKAEAEMYAAKRKYYSEQGIDRRKSCEWRGGRK